MSVRDELTITARRRVEYAWRFLDVSVWLGIEILIACAIGSGLLQLAGVQFHEALVVPGTTGFAIPALVLTVAVSAVVGIIPVSLTQTFLRAISGADIDDRWALVALVGFGLAILGGLSALGHFLAEHMSRPLLVAAGMILAFSAAILGWLWHNASEWVQAQQSLRRRLRWVFVAFPVALLTLGATLPARGDAALSVGFAALGAGVAAVGLLAALQRMVSIANRHVVDYGPTVSGTSVALLVLWAPAIVLISQAVSGLQQTKAYIPQAWSWVTLVVVAVGGVMVALRSFRRPDSIVSPRPVSARRFAAQVAVLKRMGRGSGWRTSSWLEKSVCQAVLMMRRNLHDTQRILVAAFEFVVELLKIIFSVVDFFLADVLAVLVGARLRGRVRRYAALTVVLAATAVAVWLLPGVYAIAGLAAAFLVALAITRRWSWIEADRERYWAVADDQPGSRSRIRIGFDQDLGDEAIVSFLAIFVVHAPLCLMALDEAYGLFAFQGVGAPQYMDWLAYIGGELAKAVPLVDWSEIYGVRNDAVLSPSTEWGRHSAFTLRVMMDLLLLATILQVFSSAQRSARQFQQFNDPGDGTAFLDPFEERDALIAAGDDNGVLKRVRFYDGGRLRQLVRAPKDRRAALGAARVAGYGLCADAIEALIYPPTDVEFGQKEINQLGRLMRGDLRDSAHEGLARRARELPADHPAGGFRHVLMLLDKPPSYRPKLPEVAAAKRELALMREHRDIEALVRRASGGAPSVRKAALAELSSLSDKQLNVLFDLVAADDEDIAQAAVAALERMAQQAERRQSIRARLLSLLHPGGRTRVLIAAIDAAARLRANEAGDALAALVRHRALSVRLAAIRSIGSIGQEAGETAVRAVQQVAERIVTLGFTTTEERAEATFALLRIKGSGRGRWLQRALDLLEGR